MWKLLNNKEKTVFVLSLFVLFFWVGLSYKWYTCGIKGFCDAKPIAQEVEIPEEKPKDAPKLCEAYLTKYIKLGAQNDEFEVRKLEAFLNTYEGESLPMNGVYDKRDELAVKRFQEKYRADVLTPWGMNKPSGFVYKTTLDKINKIYCDNN